MRVRIHRGAQEVGGSCLELEADGQRLVLDVGLPLSAVPGEETALPQVPGLTGGDPSLVGVVLSHAHPDHYGLVDRVGSDVPIYASAATARILREAAFFTRAGVGIRLAGQLQDGRPLRLGPFTLTPFLVDHSAFDAYAVLVEAGRRRLFYTGDIRFHGRKAATVERLIQSPPEDVHVLLMEGTQVGRPRTTRPALSERDVEERARSVFSESEGLALCFFSPLNVDRLVSLFRAAKRSGRTFVYDLYAASVPADSNAMLTGVSTTDAQTLLHEQRFARIVGRRGLGCCSKAENPSHQFRSMFCRSLRSSFAGFAGLFTFPYIKVCRDRAHAADTTPWSCASRVKSLPQMVQPGRGRRPKSSAYGPGDTFSTTSL